MAIVTIATSVLAALLVTHLASIGMAAGRCRARPVPVGTPAPPVSVVRPLRGLDTYEAETLGSGFGLAYPSFELLFCVADGDDPVVPLVERLIGEHPGVPARLLVGDDRVSANPKLNNCVKGWNAARHDWIVLTDSNVLMPPDYLSRLMAAWRPDTGLVCSPPVGSRPADFGALVECAFLNTYQARWQYAADTLGLGFAQGKTMLWRRAVLDDAGGIAMLGREIAEDAASTKLVRRAGLRVRLVDGPFEQPLGPRGLHDVWHRQLRWARLRRATFGLYFAPEILTGIVPAVIAGAVALMASGLPLLPGLLALAIVWYGAEIALARRAGWPIGWRMPVAMVLRDLLIPALWAAAWLGRSFTWRGHEMVAGKAGALPPGETTTP